MKKYNKKTEDVILQIAKKVFQEKGFSGARTQEIADKAKINKALVHYYFRTKEKLFEKVFMMSLEKIFKNLSGSLNSDLPLMEKIEVFVDKYIDFIEENNNLFIFVLSEAKRNKNFAEKFAQVPLKQLELMGLFEQIEEEIKKGNIREVVPVQFFINLISMCIFPYLASPIIDELYRNLGQDVGQLFLNRKKNILETVR
ncbi:MAG: hypothetical protein B6226_04200, partial [Candidatus Cloacimonetes bacterium 4572_65]